MGWRNWRERSFRRDPPCLSLNAFLFFFEKTSCLFAHFHCFSSSFGLCRVFARTWNVGIFPWGPRVWSLFTPVFKHQSMRSTMEDLEHLYCIQILPWHLVSFPRILSFYPFTLAGRYLVPASSSSSPPLPIFPEYLTLSSFCCWFLVQ